MNSSWVGSLLLSRGAYWKGPVHFWIRTDRNRNYRDYGLWLEISLRWQGSENSQESSFAGGGCHKLVREGPKLCIRLTVIGGTSGPFNSFPIVDLRHVDFLYVLPAWHRSNNSVPSSPRRSLAELAEFSEQALHLHVTEIVVRSYCWSTAPGGGEPGIWLISWRQLWSTLSIP